MQPQLESQARPVETGSHISEDFYSVLRGLRRHKWLIGGCAVACTALGLIFALNMSTTFQATARLLVREQVGRLLPGAGGVSLQSVKGGEESLSTHVVIIRSPIVVERALERTEVKGLTVDWVIDHLTVTVPDPSANVIQVSYSAGSKGEAVRVLAAVIGSYEEFLRHDYDINVNKTIGMFIKAREEISEKLTKMEKEYLEFRRNNPTYSSTDNGRSFAQHRLEQWEQEGNRAAVRSMQLQTQLELAHKSFRDGADAATVAGAVSRLAALIGDHGTTQTNPEASAVPGRSFEEIEAQLSDVAFQRMTAARLLEHLREGRDGSAPSPGAGAEADRYFNADPEVVALRTEIERTKAKYDQLKRLTRRSDPAVTNTLNRVKDLEGRLDRLRRLRLPALAAELARSNADDDIRNAESQLKVLTAKEAALRESLAELKADRLAKARQDREKLIKQGGAGDVRVRQLDELIARLGENTEVTVAPKGEAKALSLLGSIEQTYQAIESMRQRIQDQFEKDLAESRKDEIGMLAESNLRTGIERQRVLFHSVVDQLNQAKLVSDFGTTNCQVINPPGVRANQSKRVLICFAALLAGTILGSTIACLIDQMDTRIRSLPEMRRALNCYVLGIIPELSREQRETCGSIGLICHTHPRSFVSEAYKSIRTNFELLRRSRDARVVIVTSPNVGDGKSITSSNLAISLAHVGRKVLLVDGDLRRPTQHQIHCLCRDRGLTHTLKDILPLSRAVRPSQVANLDLLPAGPTVANPSELLASPQLAEVLKEMRQAYDIVVFDTPPLLAVADASILAQSVDGIVLVVRTSTTCRPDVERLAELLQTLGTPVLGAVINGLTSSEMGKESGYRYGYGANGVYGTVGEPGLAVNNSLSGSISLTAVEDGRSSR
jgi:capsular exopolysaccharide synthesis family protein